jgi:hypothetical protein
MKRFVEGTDRGQGTLFPECLEEWICEDNPVPRRLARARNRFGKLPWNFVPRWIAISGAREVD